jgi:uncharacterized protein YbcI
VLYDQPLGELTRAISNETVRLIADYTGRGPTKVRTTVNGDWVFITLQDTLTTGEQRLALGDGQTVLSTRKSYQHVMREELEATVTRHLGRKVIAFLSDNHIEPDVAIEAFLLEQESSASTATPIK